MSLIIGSTGARQLPAELVNNSRVKYVENKPTDFPIAGVVGEKAVFHGISDDVLNDMSQAIRDGKARPINFDTVEISEEAHAAVCVSLTHTEKAETTRFTNADVSAAARNLSALMEENGADINFRVSLGMSEAQMAEHFGIIGKQIDDAFAAGKISKQEYDDLNLGLKKYTEAMSSKSERTAAMWEVAKQNAQATLMKIRSGASKEEMAGHAESIKENLQAQISKFVEEYCCIDRSLLNSLITRVRGGESLFPEGTVHTYARENTAGYFKNGFVPFVPVEYI